MPKRPTQVIVLGHPLSNASLRWLKRQGPFVVYYVMFHIPSFDKVYETVEKVFLALDEQGVDLTGNTRTIFQASGTSVGALTMAAAWAGLTGHLPEVMNLIRVGNSDYAPSPELPIVDLNGFAEKIQADCERYGVRVIVEDEEYAKRDAIEDGHIMDGVIPLGSMRNQVRPLRSLQFNQAKKMAAMLQAQTHGGQVAGKAGA